MDNLLNLLSLADQLGRESTSPQALLNTFLPRLVTSHTDITTATVYRLGTTALLQWATHGEQDAPARVALTEHTRYEQALTSDAIIRDQTSLIAPLRVQDTPLGVLKIQYKAPSDLRDEVVGALAQHLALQLNQCLLRAIFARQQIASVALQNSHSAADVMQTMVTALDMPQAQMTIYLIRRQDSGQVDSLYRLTPHVPSNYQQIDTVAQNVLQSWHDQWLKLTDLMWYAGAEEVIAPEAMHSVLLNGNTKSAYMLPLRYGETLLGVVVVASTDAIALTPSERSILQTIADKAAITLQQIQLNVKRDQQTSNAVTATRGENAAFNTDADIQRLQEFTAYSHVVQSVFDEDAILKATLEAIFMVVNAQYVAISLYNQTTQTLEMRAEQHFETQSINNQELITEQTHTLAYRAWTAQAMRQIDDLSTESDVVHPQRSSLKTVLDLIIQGRSGILGILEIGSQDVAAFTDTDVTLLIQISSQLGIALANVATYLMSSRRATMKTLTNEISGRIQRQSDMEGLMQVTVEALSKALHAEKARIRLGVDAPTLMQKDAQ